MSAPSEDQPPAPAKVPPADDRPSRKELIAYSAAGSAEGLSIGMANGLATPLLNIGMGINPATISTLMALRGLFDAVTDPAMGQYSDNFRSRWGRRRPFILLGAFLVAIVTSLMWMFPLDWDKHHILIWFGVGLFSLALATTVFSVAHFALGIEMAPDYHERTRVVAYKSFVGKLSTFVSPWLYPFCVLPIFAHEVIGARVLGLVIAVTVVATGIWAFRATKERTRIDQDTPKEKFLVAVRRIGSNTNFLRVTGIYVLLISMLQLFNVFQLYLNIYYVFGGDKVKGASVAALTSSLGSVLALASIPLVTWLCRKIQKHHTLRIALGLMFVGDVLKWFVMRPETPYAQLVLPFCLGLGISSVFVVLGSMQADLVDEDELISGQRREGLFSCVAAWMMKSAGALAAAGSGWLLVWTGFDVNLATAQSAETFFWLRIFNSFAPGLMVIGCFFMLHRYPLTEARMMEIQSILRQRRETADAG